MSNITAMHGDVTNIKQSDHTTSSLDAHQLTNLSMKEHPFTMSTDEHPVHIMPFNSTSEESVESVIPTSAPVVATPATTVNPLPPTIQQQSSSSSNTLTIVFTVLCGIIALVLLVCCIMWSWSKFHHSSVSMSSAMVEPSAFKLPDIPNAEIQVVTVD